MDKILRDKILAVTKRGSSRAAGVDFFRVALGLIYLDGIMTDEEVDFKRLDKMINRFIYQSIGGGHSITSILQFLSGKDALAILNSERFITAFSQYCNEVPLDRIPDLLAVNLSVAKQISGLPLAGPVHDWVSAHQQSAHGQVAMGEASELPSSEKSSPAIEPATEVAKTEVENAPTELPTQLPKKV